jgi:release factor glutamine methyltransferase
MTITEWLTHARERLAQTGCPDPDVDARWIAEDALGMTRQDMVFEGDRAIPRAQLYTLESMLDRRAEGEPAQYILGSADFMGLRFRVDHGVLIPRQDTETLVEAALIELRQRPGHPTLLDLCCGSGCVGLSLASLAPHVKVTLADISPEALEIAKANQKALEVRAELKQGDLFNAVGRERFDVITANPPYIPSGELPALQREVRFEPTLALDGGADGLDFYRRIAEAAADHLNPGGAVFLEVGINEAPAVLALLKEHLPCVQAGTAKDLCGVDRVVFAKTRNEE